MLHSLFCGSAIIVNKKTDKTWIYELFIYKQYPGTLTTCKYVGGKCVGGTCIKNFIGTSTGNGLS